MRKKSRGNKTEYQFLVERLHVAAAAAAANRREGVESGSKNKETAGRMALEFGGWTVLDLDTVCIVLPGSEML